MVPWLVFLAIFNRFVYGWLLAKGLWGDAPQLTPEYFYPIPRLLDTVSVLMLGIIGFALFSGRRLVAHFKQGPGLNLWLWIWGMGVLLITNPVLPGKHAWIRIIWVLMILVQSVRVFYLGIVKSGTTSPLFKNIGLGVFSIVFLFLLLEGTFMVYPRSHQNMMTHASRIWYYRYWHLNDWGYRTRPIEVEVAEDNRNLLIVGDSFTSGWGVADPKDRFSDLLQERLGEEMNVYNIGENGAGPESELVAIREFPLKVEEVVLCWYVNDIHDAAETAGIDFSAFTAETEIRMRELTWEKRSYFLNYLYWLFPHTELTLDYYAFLKSGFANNRVLEEHFDELGAIKEYCEEQQIRFSVVLFPILKDVGGSEFALQPIRDFWDAQNVPCLDLTSTFDGYSERDLTVNANDTHPNEFANRLVADTLYPFLKMHHSTNRTTVQPAPPN